MKTPIMIRDYESGDMEQCRELWGQLTEKHREIYSDPSICGGHPEDCFNEHLGQVGLRQLWVASLDSEVVGLVGHSRIKRSSKRTSYSEQKASRSGRRKVAQRKSYF